MLRATGLPSSRVATFGSLLGPPGLLGAGVAVGQCLAPREEPGFYSGTTQRALRGMAINREPLATLFPRSFPREHPLSAFIRALDFTDCIGSIARGFAGTVLSKLC